MLDAYNEILSDGKGWPVAMTDVFSGDRAAAIRSFLCLSDKPDWVRKYFGYLADSIVAKPGLGFDWVISESTYLRAREGNFSGMAA